MIEANEPQLPSPQAIRAAILNAIAEGKIDVEKGQELLTLITTEREHVSEVLAASRISELSADSIFKACETEVRGITPHAHLDVPRIHEGLAAVGIGIPPDELAKMAKLVGSRDWGAAREQARTVSRLTNDIPSLVTILPSQVVLNANTMPMTAKALQIIAKNLSKGGKKRKWPGELVLGQPVYKHLKDDVIIEDPQVRVLAMQELKDVRPFAGRTKGSQRQLYDQSDILNQEHCLADNFEVGLELAWALLLHELLSNSTPNQENQPPIEPFQLRLNLHPDNKPAFVTYAAGSIVVHRVSNIRERADYGMGVSSVVPEKSGF